MRIYKRKSFEEIKNNFNSNLQLIEEIYGIGDKYDRYCKVKCYCGKEWVTDLRLVSTGRIKSCGCILKTNKKGIDNPNHRHGLRNTRFWYKWNGLRRRIGNVNYDHYKDYGGRGIKCLWKKFEEFRDDMYESYLEHCKLFGEKQTTLDRVNVNGNYCKDNCKWSTRDEQRYNKQTTIRLEYNGQIHTLKERENIIGIKESTLYCRIKQYGRSVEKTLTTKLRNENNINKESKTNL